jgi:hypothetical protein
VLRKELSALTPEELRFLVTRQLRLVAEDDPLAEDAAFLTEVMLATYERRSSQVGETCGVCGWVGGCACVAAAACRTFRCPFHC